MTEDGPDWPADDLDSISAGELACIAELLIILDEFLRSDPIAGLFAAHLRANGYDHPRYDAALLIDQISFTARALRTRRRDAASRHRRVPTDDAGQV
jgi:hypothetical protein